MTQHFDIKQKRKAAEMAIKHKATGGSYKSIAEVVGVHQTMIGKWVLAYEAGKLDEPKPEPKKVTIEALEQIDIRPELKRIAKALEINNETLGELTKGMVKACIRLDDAYQRNAEDHENFNSILNKVLTKITVKGN